ncbi:hypothetical protein ACN20G_16670 [Streptomyces sp. BI20]|uniref:hypothetical protein n=1 Tax=Streptomyces sp. BI20 TaxID=3403460 RepID=UPI003C7295C7
MRIEIRVICDPTDTDHVTTTLAGALPGFKVTETHPGSHLGSHLGGRTLLYATADPTEPATQDAGSGSALPGVWLAPETAYQGAPAVTREIGWVTRQVRTVLLADDPAVKREYYLRKAALLDRIALNENLLVGSADNAVDSAENAARQLLDHDTTHGRFDPDTACGTSVVPVPAHATAYPRGYVRIEYATWATTAR